MDSNSYRLGLDMGTNSIGWAAINLDEQGKSCGILDMGVRIFPDGRGPRDETSNAVQRRLARGMRRRGDRYLMRRSKLINALVRYGLMPSDSQERKYISENLDPYELRAEALDRRLKLFELGRAIFHLNQRRGFKSNRNASGDDENEAKRTRAGISELRRRMENSGARTLGEYLHRRRRKGKAVRIRPGMEIYPDRAMYADEFDAIRSAQQPLQTLDDEQWESLREIIFFQRPLKPVDPGWCTFEENQYRAARALPLFQEFRMLQELANLKLYVGSEPERPLNEGEMERMLKRLRSGGDINLKRPVKSLRLPEANFNLSAGLRTTLKGDETTAKLKRPDMFGKKWLCLSLEERNEIVNVLLNTDDPEIVRERAVVDWGLNEEQARAVANVSLVSGYGSLSERAIRRILPHMGTGMGYSEAVRAAGYDHHSDFRGEEAHDSLPYYGEVLPRAVVGANPQKDTETDGEVARYGRIANPTVHIGLNQLRRVVNRLIEVYGKPEEIVVELARDLKMNREQKQNSRRQQRAGAERNERFREDLESAEETVTPEILRKLRLWDEQKKGALHICPYTGKNISFEMAVSAATEVDHILPFSRTLDDSMANRVVCMAYANREKGNRTPYEAFGHNTPRYKYEQILDNVADFPSNKRWRFHPDAMERFEGDNDFLDRQLNETRYLSRTAREYLAHLYDERAQGSLRVRVIPGHMTALLRRGWGLRYLLSDSADGETVRKQRDDHRHHAIDAFTVANTTQGLFQEFSVAAGSSYQNAEEKLASLTPLPWDGFHRNELKPFLDSMIVSYRPDHGTRGMKAGGATTGQLHNDTAYGIINLDEDAVSQVVHRKHLNEFKARKSLDAIIDPYLREALTRLWDEVDGKPGEFASEAAKGVLVNGRTQKVRGVRVIETLSVTPIRNSEGQPYKGYKMDSNDFADIWQMSDKGKTWRIVVVPTFQANQRDFDKTFDKKFRPKTTRGVHKGKPDPNAKRLMRLYKGDMGALGEGDSRRIVRVRKFSEGRVVLDYHVEADVDGRERRKEIVRNNGHSASRLRSDGFRKIHVDEIGRVRDPGPRSL